MSTVHALAFLALLCPQAVAQEERCAPWINPAASPTDAPTISSLPEPTKFQVVFKKGTQPELVFLGDSLTSEPFAQMVSQFLGGRAYRVFQIGGKNSAFLSSLFQNEPVPATSSAIIWIGRNSDPNAIANVVADIENAALHVASQHYLILDFLSGRDPSEQPGRPRRTSIDNLNSAIKLHFGTRVLHTRSFLSCSDFEDNIHLLRSGQEKVAKEIARELSARGW